MKCFRRISRSLLLLPLLGLSACASLVNPLSAVKPGSTVDDIQGKFLDGIDLSKIDYASQSKARVDLTTKKDKRSFPAEPYIGIIDHSRIIDPQTVIYDRQVEEFINDIIKKLRLQWKGQQPPDIRIAFVVDTPDVPFVAESGSDGTMYFGLSAIKDVGSTDELVFITAHELAHVLLNDGVRVAQQKEVDAANQTAGSLAIMANSASRGANASAAATGTNSNIAFAVIGLEIFLDDVLSPAFTREQETEADILAADLMIKAGYSPLGVNNLMQRLEDLDRKAVQKEKQLRAAQVAAQQEQEKKQATAKGQTMLFSTAAINTALTGGINDLFNRIKKDHPAALDREKDLNKYIKREYARERQTKHDLRPAEAEYQKFLVSVSGGPLLRRQFALAADALLKSGQLDQAYAMAQHALSGQKDTAAEPRMTLYRIRKAQFEKTGNRRYYDEAIKHVEIAWSGQEATPLIAFVLSDEYTAGGKYDSADGVLVEAGTRFDRAPDFMPRRVANWVAANRKEKAFGQTYECVQVSHGAELRSICEAALPQTWYDDYQIYVIEREKAEQRLR